MSDDYPAAHSMDTDWFAVDADGHVAMLNSGEDGAVPRSYLDAFGSQTDLEFILDRAPRDQHGSVLVGGDALAVQRQCSPGAIVDEIEQRMRAAGRSLLEEEGFESVLASPGADAFLVLREASDAVGLGSRYEPVVAFREDPRVIFVGGCNVARLWDAFRRGRVLGGRIVPYQNCRRDLVLAMGLYIFEYEGFDRDRAAPVYERDEAPTRALDVGALPDDLQARLPRLPVSFATQSRLQPAEHVPCSSWQETWRSVSGRLMDFDGNDVTNTEATADEDTEPQAEE